MQQLFILSRPQRVNKLTLHVRRQDISTHDIERVA